MSFGPPLATILCVGTKGGLTNSCITTGSLSASPLFACNVIEINNNEMKIDI